MILSMFILLICICAFLMVFGYYSKIRAFSVVGLSILFILSSWIILYSYQPNNFDPLGLQYQSGTTITTLGNTMTITYNYVTYNDTTTIWVGILLGVVSATGMILVLLNDK